MSISPHHLRRAMIRDALIYWLYIPAAVIGGGAVLDLLFGLRALPPYRWLTYSAIILIAGGVILIQKATWDLKHYGNGTPNPMAPPERLVTSGSYAYCRNPMFLGYDLAALGFILLCRSQGMLVAAYPLFILLQVRFLRNREETVLVQRFGAEFQTYRDHVPFLIPRLYGKGKPS